MARAALGEGEGRDRRTRCSTHLSTHLVLVEGRTIVARVSTLRTQGRPVVRVVHVELPRRGAHEDAPQLGAAYPTEVDMAEAREVLVVRRIGRTPPAGILVILVQLSSAHHIEGGDAHEPVRYDSTGIGGPEVARPDEGVDFIDQSPLRLSCSAEAKQQHEGYCPLGSRLL